MAGILDAVKNAAKDNGSGGQAPSVSVSDTSTLNANSSSGASA